MTARRRRLAAIMAVDAVGCRKLTGEDESGRRLRRANGPTQRAL
jgi:hypothetical protein